MHPILNDRANQLAHQLQASGVGPELLVGLCVERSLEMIIGLLGILKAGGAYLPLDPSYPPARLTFMLQDAQIDLLLTQSHIQADLPPTDAQVICLDRDWPQIAAQSRDNPASQVQAGNLAYVIYTSGSTGQPKGVMIEHGGICHLAQTQKHTLQVAPGDRVLQFASLNFDASVWEIFMALCAGATLYVAPAADLLPGLPLTQLLREQAITYVTLVPAVLATLSPAEVPTLQTIIVAGEACSATLVARWQRERRFFNAYGPTEATVCATIMPCTAETFFLSAPPIGQPLAHVQIYILDEHLQPVAAGAAGELYIGGAGLARGYLNRPALTAEKFMANPLGPGRLYKTGDLARYRPDGNIDFLGRLDQQVKIRGFRIELGEIEAQLMQHPGVQNAVVVARAEASGEQRLVAYVVPQQAEDRAPASQGTHQTNGFSLSAIDLRGFLQQRLPDSMTPAAFVLVDNLPLTPNGKVDRNALPAPTIGALAVMGQFAPPQTATETVLAAIWTQVLGLPQVGRHDNFFAIGGHSLLATQIVARLRPAFGVEIPVRTLFEAPTLAELGQLLEKSVQMGVMPWSPIVRLAERPSILPLSYAQQRLWFLDQLEGAQGIPSITYNVPCSLHLRGTLDVEALHAALNAIVQRHELLRTTFSTTNGVAQQVIAPSLALALPIFDLAGQAAVDQQIALQQLLHTAARQPFDLTSGPLIRTALYRLGEEEHVLLLNFHHIITDGWSLGILLHELDHLYTAGRTGKPGSLSALPLQYADFAL